MAIKIKAKIAKEKIWPHLYVAERNIVRIFVGALLLYLISRIFLAFIFNFFGGQGFNMQSLENFGGDVRSIWLYHIGGFFIVLNSLMFIATFVFFKLGWKYRPPLYIYPPPSDFSSQIKAKTKPDPALFEHWKKIVSKANTGTQENMKTAIIESDALLDQHLKNQGFDGEHLAERLSKLNHGSFKTLEPVWKAHKLRNQIVHTPNSKVTANQAQNALLAYRNFFKETKAF